VRATAEGPVSKQTSVNSIRLLDAMFNGVFGVTGCLEISIKALRALTVMIRDQDKDEHIFDSILNAVDSETEGHSAVASRTQARASQRQLLFTTSLQTSSLQQTQEASAIHTATNKATAASNKTLETMQSLLSGSQTLNRKTEEVTRVAAEYGQLVLALTFFTFVCACVSTCVVGPSQPRECHSGEMNANILSGSLLDDRLGTQV
jgi:hypothetical protein